MTNEELLKAINSLTDDAKRRVEKFIARVRGEHPALPESTHEPFGSFKDEPFFGIWADREDMIDGGAAWVRLDQTRAVGSEKTE